MDALDLLPKKWTDRIEVHGLGRARATHEQTDTQDTLGRVYEREAVARAHAGDRSVRGLEAELGLTPTVLRQWVRAYEAQVARSRGHLPVMVSLGRA